MPGPRSQSLTEALRAPEAKRAYVRRLFATIADRYDLITRLLSYGRDSAWKRDLASMSHATVGTRALDLAAGTGDIAFAIAARGAEVVALDVTHRMLQLARAKAITAGARPPSRGRCAFVTGDMMALPFPDASFDLVTTGYGIRNVPVIQPALAEIHRVLRPGGLLLSLDFNKPGNAFVRWIYLGYLTVIGSVLGFVLHGDPDTYRYIPESIKRYPGADGVARLLGDAGFARSVVHPRLAGLMAINEARRL